MTKSNVIQLGMNDTTLRKRIAEVAADSARVQISKHAKKRMRQRQILLTQVLQVLVGGSIVEHAHLNIHGNWQCTLQRRVAGDLVKVAAALVLEDKEAVVVITVMD